jgi:hypothetical protein
MRSLGQTDFFAAPPCEAAGSRGGGRCAHGATWRQLCQRTEGHFVAAVDFADSVFCGVQWQAGVQCTDVRTSDAEPACNPRMDRGELPIYGWSRVLTGQRVRRSSPGQAEALPWSSHRQRLADNFNNRTRTERQEKSYLFKIVQMR